MKANCPDDFFQEFRLKSSIPLSENDLPILCRLFLLKKEQDQLERGRSKDYKTKKPNLFRQIPFKGEDSGGIDTDYFFGICYAEGIGVEQSASIAIQYFKKCAEQGHVIAQNNVGYAYANGEGVPKSASEAFKFFQMAAEQGNPIALANLSVCYSKGFGVERSEENAIDQLFRAYLCGDNISMWAIYLSCLMGSIKPNMRNLPIFKEFADMGIPLFQMKVGGILFKEVGREAEAFRYMKMAADQGLAPAQEVVAIYFNLGKGVEKSSKKAVRYFQMAFEQENFTSYDAFAAALRDAGKSPQEAFPYYKLAAERGSPFSKWWLGMCYEEGWGVEPSPQEAFRFYKMSSDLQFIPAILKVAECFKNGFGIEKSEENAETFFHKAFLVCKKEVDKGNTLELVQLGFFYQFGQGVQASFKKAFGYYQLAAQQKSGLANCILGDCYLKGEGVEKNEQMALYYYKLAADLGDASAFRMLGDCYSNGYGVIPSMEEAFFYYHQAAILDDPHARYLLGEDVNYLSEKMSKIIRAYVLRKPFWIVQELRKLMWLATPPVTPQGQYLQAVYYSEHPEKEGSLKKAFELFEKAAHQNHGFAQYQLAKCYSEGKGVDQSDAYAFFWLKKAADAGVTRAMLDIGWCYKNGKGVPHSTEEAFRYWKLLADQGSATGAWLVSECYFFGKGVAQSDAEAFRYMQFSADTGSPLGLQSLGCFYIKGIGTEKDETKGFECFKLAAQEGNTLAEFHLGLCYEKGLGIAQNKEEALKHFKAAADNGLIGAKEKMKEYSERNVA